MKTKEIVILLFAILSLLVAIGSVINAVRYRKTHSKTKSILTAWQVLTIGIYFAVVLQYIPVYYQGFEWGDGANALSPLFLSIFQSFRVFIIDGEYGLIQDLLKGCSKSLHIGFSVYATSYFIIAPALTAGFVLSMFDNITSTLKFRIFKNRPTYILSKLNEKSVVLARSIRQNADKEGKKVTIVFTNVIGGAEEEKYDMQCEAQDKDIRGICLKHDVTNLNFNNRDGKVEIFLISDDESENIEHALRLTELCNKHSNIKLYVYATSVGSAYIIDSLDKGEKLISDDMQKEIIECPEIQEKLLADITMNKVDIPLLEGGFQITRVDCVYSLVLNTFKKSGIFEICKKSEDKTISVMIVGMGEYGKQILKTALWFCQMDGYKLEINVIDAGFGRNGMKRNIESILSQECPEIISMNQKHVDGDANYDICFFENVDLFSGEFDKIFSTREYCERMKRTKMAFVAVGDDDKNIEASIMLRKLFDRVNQVTNENLKVIQESELNDLPLIYAVVYDDKKADNLNVNKSLEKDNYLVNYRGTPYHIRFIGSLSSQYSYDSILQLKEFESAAFCYHIDWVKIEKNIRENLKKAENRAILDMFLEEKGVPSLEDLTWNDANLYDANGNFSNKAAAVVVRNNIEKYMKYEYFKKSSISKALHKEVLMEVFKDELGFEEDNFLCMCEKCVRRRKTEHMRWNAYMRVNGYIYGAKRSDRGLVHPDLKPFDKLDMVAKLKD